MRETWLLHLPIPPRGQREAPCLLDIAPPGAGLVARPVLSMALDGETAWREFDVVRIFAGDEDARVYAAQNAVDDVEL